MFKKDAQGLEVTTVSESALSAMNCYMEQCLSYGNRAESSILEAVTAEPESVLANTYAAAYYLTQESASVKPIAIHYLRTARKYVAQANHREQLWLLATEAWAERKIEEAIAYCEAIVANYPQDLLAVQQGQYHYFYAGNKAGLINIANSALAANANNHYLLGMLAFGLEQSNYLAEAERMARQALAINRADPWAQHAIAHVMETQGRYRQGLIWMESFTDTWHNCNSMLYTHNWWHIALFHLANGETAKVLFLFDEHIWGKARQNTPKDQVGAISLLMRLEMQGVEVGNRWQHISAYLPERIHEHNLPFQDLHYVYALARANQLELAREMLTSMEKHAQNVQPYLKTAWQEVALPTARGAIAHAMRDWKKSARELKPVLHRFHEIGGSNTQRKLFEQIYSNACRQTILKGDLYAYGSYAQAIAS